MRDFSVTQVGIMHTTPYSGGNSQVLLTAADTFIARMDRALKLYLLEYRNFSQDTFIARMDRALKQTLENVSKTAIRYIHRPHG